jgi:hypothetical protein
MPPVLVNNAAGNSPVPAENLSPNNWRSVVGGANWQRRAMLQPEFTPTREQLGKGPFKP